MTCIAAVDAILRTDCLLLVFLLQVCQSSISILATSIPLSDHAVQHADCLRAPVSGCWDSHDCRDCVSAHGSATEGAEMSLSTNMLSNIWILMELSLRHLSILNHMIMFTVR